MTTMVRKARELLKLLFAPVLLRVRSGPLRGKRWIASSGSAFVTGRYEPEKTAAIARTVRPGDVGAHVGYFTLLMSDVVGDAGRVVAFEPRPINHRFLLRHVAVNAASNVEVLACCVGERTGPARLETRTGTGTGHVSETGDVAADMVSIDELVASGRLPPPTFLKIDVEGGELGVLRGARRVLADHRPRMVLATHSPELESHCRAYLADLGYEMSDIGQLKGDTEHVVLPTR